VVLMSCCWFFRLSSALVFCALLCAVILSILLMRVLSSVRSVMVVACRFFLGIVVGVMV